MDNYIGQWFVEKTDNVTLEQAVNDIVEVTECAEEYDFSVEDLMRYVENKWNLSKLDLSFMCFANYVNKEINNEMQAV
jgi:hypothetical protein